MRSYRAVLLGTAVAAFTVLPAAAAFGADPASPPAAVTSADAKHESNLVDSEDIRLRSTFARFGVLKTPTMLPPLAGSLPTLLLPARTAPYTADDLVTAKAMTREVDGTALLTTSVVVGPDARLQIDAGVGALKLQSTKAGFATLTSWRGAIDIVGQAAKPLVVEGWDTDQLKPDTVEADGRAYVRTLGGELVLRYVHASDLGFWSGRTGGVSWTGSKGQPSTGGVASSTVDDSAYGVYVSGSQGVQIVNVRLERNEHTGLAIHRDGVNTLVSGAVAFRNSGEGFVIDRAAGSRVMRSQSIQNAGDGIVLDGRGIGVVATASGVQINQAKGSVVDSNVVTDNGRYGIRVLGGQDTIVRNNTVSGKGTGIVVKSGSNGTQLLNNTVNGSTDAGIQIGPDAKRTAITANTIGGAPIGIRTQDATTNIISKNIITGATEFAVTAHGVSTGTVIRNNRLSGVGWRPVDVRKATGLPPKAVGANNAAGWVTRTTTHWYAVFERHPALIVWIVVLILPIIGWWSRHRRRNEPARHPYPESALLLRRERKVIPPEELVGAGAYPAGELQPALAYGDRGDQLDQLDRGGRGDQLDRDDRTAIDDGWFDRPAIESHPDRRGAAYSRFADRWGGEPQQPVEDEDDDTQVRPTFAPQDRGRWDAYEPYGPYDPPDAVDQDGYQTHDRDHRDSSPGATFNEVDQPWRADRDEYLAGQAVPVQSNGHGRGTRRYRDDR